VTRLELQQVTVAFGSGARRLVAVRGVDLTVESGQVVGLVGESGSGKSTVARAVTGLVPVTEGRLLFDGQPLGELRRRARRERRRIAMVFQDPSSSLDPRMPVGESIAEALPPQRRSRSATRGAVGELLELVGLEADRAGLPPAATSGGQRQRVALARALAAEPEILVADEITSALDVSVQGRSSTSSATCSSGWASGCCSSRTTSRWCGTSAGPSR
jgi:peptide/nickel transport system ATP-binding protein